MSCRIDICKFCGVEMDTVGLGFANGWRCPKCGHTEVDSCSADPTQKGEVCACVNCQKGAPNE